MRHNPEDPTPEFSQPKSPPPPTPPSILNPRPSTNSPSSTFDRSPILDSRPSILHQPSFLDLRPILNPRSSILDPLPPPPTRHPNELNKQRHHPDQHAGQRQPRHRIEPQIEHVPDDRPHDHRQPQFKAERQIRPGLSKGVVERFVGGSGASVLHLSPYSGRRAADGGLRRLRRFFSTQDGLRPHRTAAHLASAIEGGTFFHD